MPSATRRLAAAIALTSATLVAAGCGGGGSATGSGQAKTSRARLLPQQIVRAPRHVVSAAEPQSNGIIWTLAETPSSESSAT